MAKRRPTSPKPRSGISGLVDRGSPRLNAARGLWRQGRDTDAQALFEEAIRQEPDNVQSYIVPARAYGERFRFDRMEETLAKLVRRAPQHPGVHHYIGETFAGLKLPERALASYEHAANLPGAGPPTWMELAALYERAHRLDEAEELIERAVRSGYDLPLVWLVRGRIQRRQRKLDMAEASFRKVIEHATRYPDWACEAYGEIALMRDSQEDYDGAIEAIEACKRSQRAREGVHWAVSQKGFQVLSELVDSITRAGFVNWRDELHDVAPARVALLTGFPRSGTTLLEQVLDAHSDVVSSEERDFLGNELVRTVTAHRPETPLLEVLRELSRDRITAERRRYFQAMEYLLGEPIAGRMHLDKNPAYNLIIPAMLRLFPEARLLIAIRDPRDVVLSCYLRYLPLNAVSVRFLDVQRTAERYALDMRAWLTFRELIDVPWRQIRYEDTVADVESQARAALEALGLPWDDKVLNYRQRLHESKQVTSPSYEAVAQPIYTRAIGRWQHYERIMAPALETLKPFIREFGYD
jgi:tetratricopeptide (TPR) repeat protein